MNLEPMNTCTPTPEAQQTLDRFRRGDHASAESVIVTEYRGWALYQHSTGYSCFKIGGCSDTLWPIRLHPDGKACNPPPPHDIAAYFHGIVSLLEP